MERETTTINTPVSNQKVVLKSYITGGEKRDLTALFLRSDITDVEKFHQSQDAAFKTVIVSIDDHKEGDMVDGKAFSIVGAVLAMRNEDSNFVINEINGITSDASTAEKKTS